MKFSTSILALLSIIVVAGCKKNSTSDINLSSGLIAYYPFNGNANDASGNNLNGTIKGGVTFSNDVSGKANSAVTFDGATGCIVISDSLGKFQSNAVSVAFLANLVNITNRAAYVEKINFGDATGLIYGVGGSATDNGKFEFAVPSNTQNCGAYVSNSSYLTTSTNDIIPNKWYSVVAIFSDSLQQFFVNGSLNASSKRNFSSLNQCTTNKDLVIGGWWSGDIVSVNGSMDEVRIYNRALNQDEINELGKLIK